MIFIGDETTFHNDKGREYQFTTSSKGSYHCDYVKRRETIKDINWFDILSLFFKEVDQRRKFTEDGSIDVGEGGEIVKFQIRGRTTERRKR